MRELLKHIFNAYKFEQKWSSETIDFYSVIEEKKTNFYIINYIDATDPAINPSTLNEMIKQLELEYIGNYKNDKTLKVKLQDTLEENSKSAQLDKNTSAIYPIKFSSLGNFNAYKNIIYSVEESPYFFKRYVLPYTDLQVAQLKEILDDGPDNDISSRLSNFANQETEYYALSTHRKTDTAYELVIKLFSKIPFLQYDFEPKQKPTSAKKQIESKISIEQRRLHELIILNSININNYIESLDINISDKEIADELDKRIKEEY